VTTTPVDALADLTEVVDYASPLVRLRDFFDEGTLRTIGGVDDSGVLAGRGVVEGTPAIAFCTDSNIKAGAMGVQGCNRIVAAIEDAVTDGLPVVGIWHSGGARLPEGVAALDAVGQVFAAIVQASGKIPQISVVLGPAAGGGAYGPALTDIVIMSGGGRIFVTGPEVVKSVTGEQVDLSELGGTDIHSTLSGVAHIVTKDDFGAIQSARKLASMLGHQGALRPDTLGIDIDLSVNLPERTHQAYDVKPLIKALLDEPGVELHPRWAPNIVTILGRFAGRTVGVIANNPMRLGGCLDASSGEKAARFVRMCDSLGVPLIVLVDVPGYLPGLDQEREGVVRRGAKLLHAFAEAVVPRVTLVTRKAYGGAYIAMNSRSLGATAVYAWPNAEIAVMGASAAVGILHRRRLAAEPPETREALRAKLIDEQLRETGGVQRALETGVVDDIVKPEETRRRLAAALLAPRGKRGSHGNIPL
jgi:acetyl-CoA/propionyl-CoA carboxylase carboxyl transferase subunit